MGVEPSVVRAKAKKRLEAEYDFDFVTDILGVKYVEERY